MKGYDIKIRLDHVRPLIWRDLIIPSEITFKDLSDIIQEIFGLLNYHLYSFSLSKNTSYSNRFKVSAPSCAGFYSEFLEFDAGIYSPSPLYVTDILKVT